MFLRIEAFWYILKRGCYNLKKNLSYALASTITMVICILLFSIFYAICANINSMVKNIESKITITVFMDEKVKENDMERIREEISKHTAVKEITYISNDQAWKEYKEEYFDGKEELAAGFAEDNPLENSSHFDISINDVSRQKELVDYFTAINGIRQVNQSQKIASIFADINKILIGFSVAIIIGLVCISLFLIQNTIKSGINNYSEEISIMKVIGSSEGFIQYPFVISGTIIGFFGSTVPLLAFYKLYDSIITYINSRFESLDSIMTFIPKKDIFGILIPFSLCMGLGIGLVGSMLATHMEINSAGNKNKE